MHVAELCTVFQFTSNIFSADCDQKTATLLHRSINLIDCLQWMFVVATIEKSLNLESLKTKEAESIKSFKNQNKNLKDLFWSSSDATLVASWSSSHGRDPSVWEVPNIPGASSSSVKKRRSSVSPDEAGFTVLIFNLQRHCSPAPPLLVHQGASWASVSLLGHVATRACKPCVLPDRLCRTSVQLWHSELRAEGVFTHI